MTQTCIYCKRTYGSWMEFKAHKCEKREKLKQEVMSYIEDVAADVDELHEMLQNRGYEVERYVVKHLLENDLEYEENLTKDSTYKNF